MIAIWSLMDRRLGAQSGIALIQPSRWHEEIPDSFFRLLHIPCVLSPAGLHILEKHHGSKV